MKNFRSWISDVSSNVTAQIISAVILGLVGLWLLNKDKNNSDVSEPKSANMDSASTPRTKEKNDEQINPEIVKLSPSDSANKNKTQNNSGSLFDIKQKAEPIELINKSEKADFAVLAITNEKKDNQLAFVFVNWLKDYGNASSSILLNTFTEQGFFKQIME